MTCPLIIKRLPRQFPMPTSSPILFFNLCFYHSFSAAVSSISNLSHSYRLMDFLLFLFPILLLSWFVLLFQWPGLGLDNNLINYWWPYTPNHLPLYPQGWDSSKLFLVSLYHPLIRIVIFKFFSARQMTGRNTSVLICKSYTLHVSGHLLLNFFFLFNI